MPETKRYTSRDSLFTYKRSACLGVVIQNSTHKNNPLHGSSKIEKNEQFLTKRLTTQNGKQNKAPAVGNTPVIVRLQLKELVYESDV